MDEREVIENSPVLVTRQTLLQGLRGLGIQPGHVLLVHSSLSSLGWVAGGAVAVIEALQDAVSPGGTVAVPTHSGGISDPANWQHPPVPESWWEPIRSNTPAFNVRLTVPRGMGAIPDTFLRYPDMKRSDHPLHSFAARGPHAERIVAGQRLDDSLGDGSPLACLYDLEAFVLLLGVGYDSCTMLHLAERRALGDRQSRTRTGAPLMQNGVRRWVAFEEPDVRSEDFQLAGGAFEAVHPVATGRVGKAVARLIPVRPLVDFGETWFRANRTA